ncbi:Cof-type HAD-IIB family hydrolase [Sediminicola sp. 1XM1-17]|uniref:Cof-type HAD-IIB family hydrolase n=1 Tax=Sediminicola sp. 1XM1-17 TaxID=3127702 RepID=UPI003077142E
MKFKILCSDLDGTLLSSKNNVSDFAIAEIQRIKSAMKVILVSARMPKSMTYLQRNLGIEDQPIICYNGALILDGKKELSSTEMTIGHLDEIYDLSESLGIQLGLYHKNEWYVEENTERVRKEIHHTQSTPLFRDTIETIKDWKDRGVGAHKIMLMGTKEATDTAFAELAKQLGQQLHLYRSNDTLIEVAPRSVSKLSAIQMLLQEGETLEDVIAFGDNYNDMEMLQHVGYGVAVANAREELKQIANAITLKNTEDGVAQFIKNHIII